MARADGKKEIFEMSYSVVKILRSSADFNSSANQKLISIQDSMKINGLPLLMF